MTVEKATAATRSERTTLPSKFGCTVTIVVRISEAHRGGPVVNPMCGLDTSGLERGRDAQHKYALHLTRAPLEGGGGGPPPVLYTCQTNGAINAKLAVSFGPSILHLMCKTKIVPTIGWPQMMSE